jgi:polyhydroxyalkanoate synthase
LPSRSVISAGIGDQRIKAATMLTAQVDFSEPGDLSVFIDEKQLDNLDQMMGDKGYLEGQAMFTTFNMLRANDLIWSFFVNNYLLGKEAKPFDLLHWNADATRMPRRMHLFYLRQMYLHNNLVKPGVVELAGVPIDLTKVTVPVYLEACREDHIAPFRSVFKARHNFSGPVRFLLAGSGHIAGVINPPGCQQVPVLAQRRRALGSRRLAQGRHRVPGLLVARLAGMACAALR